MKIFSKAAVAAKSFLLNWKEIIYLHRIWIRPQQKEENFLETILLHQSLFLIQRFLKFLFFTKRPGWGPKVKFYI